MADAGKVRKLCLYTFARQDVALLPGLTSARPAGGGPSGSCWTAHQGFGRIATHLCRGRCYPARLSFGLCKRRVSAKQVLMHGFISDQFRQAVVDRSFLQMTGYTAEEVLGHNW